MRLKQPWLYNINCYPRYDAEFKGIKFTIIQLPFGAPAVCTVLEEVIALGAKKVIFAGYAGSIHPNVKVGDFVIPTHALR